MVHFMQSRLKERELSLEILTIFYRAARRKGKRFRTTDGVFFVCFLFVCLEPWERRGLFKGRTAGGVVYMLHSRQKECVDSLENIDATADTEHRRKEEKVQKYRWYALFVTD